MTRHKPMHVNPRHPMWWRIPYAGAALMGLMTLGAVYGVAVEKDSSAWVGVIFAPLTGLGICWMAWDIRKEARNG